MQGQLTDLRYLARNTRGSEIAETAMILPLLFMLILAIFWFGQAYRIYGTITHATRQGARAAVAPVCATCAPLSTSTGNPNTQSAVTAVTSAMAAANLNTAQLQAFTSWTPPALCPCGSASSSCSSNAVQCDTSVSSNTGVCVQPNVQLSYTSGGQATGAGTCGTSVSVRYQYPYHFFIPYTSLDLGNIALPAQAQMRSETQ
jgi:Flp pilus assembly protein TadG